MNQPTQAEDLEVDDKTLNGLIKQVIKDNEELKKNVSAEKVEEEKQNDKEELANDEDNEEDDNVEEVEDVMEDENKVVEEDKYDEKEECASETEKNDTAGNLKEFESEYVEEKEESNVIPLVDSPTKMKTL